MCGLYNVALIPWGRHGGRTAFFSKEGLLAGEISHSLEVFAFYSSIFPDVSKVMATTPAAPTSAFQVIEKTLDVSFATPGAVNCATFQPFLELHRTADPIALTAVSSTRPVTLIN